MTPVYLARVSLKQYFEYFRLLSGAGDEYFYYINSAGTLVSASSAPTATNGLDPIDITPTSIFTLGAELQALWRFNSQGLYGDAFGRFTLIPENGDPGIVAGILDQAIELNDAASNQYLHVVNSTDLAVGDEDLTLFGWFYPTDLTTDRLLVGKWDEGGSSREYRLYYDSSGSRFRFEVSSDGSATASIDADTLGAPSINTWYFILVWHDATSNTLNIRVNGGSADSTAYSSGIFQGIASFAVGAHSISSPADIYFGRVDQLGVYRGILSTAQQDYLHNAGIGLDIGGTIQPTYIETHGGASDYLYADNTTGDLKSSATVPAADSVPWVITPLRLLSQNLTAQRENTPYVLQGGTPSAVTLTAQSLIPLTLYFSAGARFPVYAGHLWRPALQTIVNTREGIDVQNGLVTGQIATRIGAMTLDISDTTYDSMGLIPWDGRTVEVWRGAIENFLNLDDSFKAFWPFRAGGPFFADVLGGHTLTDHNGVAQSPNGKINEAAEFDSANSEWLSASNDAELQTGDVSFAVFGWVRLASKTGGGGGAFDDAAFDDTAFDTGGAGSDYQTIISKWEENGNQREYRLIYNGILDKFEFWVSSDGSVSGSAIPHTTTPSIDTWYFLVAWHDADNNRLGIQVDNSFVDGSYSDGVFSGSSDLRFGAISSGMETDFLDGRCDAWGFVKGRILSIDERMALYNGGLGKELSSADFFEKVFQGIVRNISWTLDDFTINFADPGEALRDPIQATNYAGTGQAEGEQDLVGHPKPLAFGFIQNAEPVLVDRPNLVYQFHDGAVLAVQAVYDQGVELTLDTSLSDVYAWTPIPGSYAVDLTDGYLRLGAEPAGVVTMDIEGSIDPDVTFKRHVQQILNVILAEHAGLSSAEIDVSALATYAMLYPGDAGLYIRESMTIEDALRYLAIGAYWGYTAAGLWTIRQLALGTSVGRITEDQIADDGMLRRNPSPISPWRLQLAYDRCWYVHTPEQIAAGADVNRKSFIAVENRYVPAENASVKTLHALAQDVQIDSPMMIRGTGVPSDPQAEVARQLNLLTSLPHQYQLSMRWPSFAIAIGDTVTLEHSRFDLSAGRDMLVIERAITASIVNGVVEEAVSLTLWG